MTDLLPFTRIDNHRELLANRVNAIEFVSEEYSVLIGRIIAYFASVERLAPAELQRITGMHQEQADAILGVFRSFKNKLDVLKVVAAPIENEAEKEVATYVRGHFTSANTMRNTYAHAAFMWRGGDELVLAPYGDMSQEYVLTLKKLRGEHRAMHRIETELDAIIIRNELPPTLFDRLPQQPPPQAHPA